MFSKPLIRFLHEAYFQHSGHKASFMQICGSYYICRHQAKFIFLFFSIKRIRINKSLKYIIHLTAFYISAAFCCQKCHKVTRMGVKKERKERKLGFVPLETPTLNLLLNTAFPVICARSLLNQTSC